MPVIELGLPANCRRKSMNREVCRRFALLAEPETGGCRRVARAAMGAAYVIHVIYVPALMLLHLAAFLFVDAPAAEGPVDACGRSRGVVTELYCLDHVWQSG
jgi:hypothetical protein